MHAFQMYEKLTGHAVSAAHVQSIHRQVSPQDFSNYDEDDDENKDSDRDEHEENEFRNSGEHSHDDALRAIDNAGVMLGWTNDSFGVMAAPAPVPTPHQQNKAMILIPPSSHRVSRAERYQTNRQGSQKNMNAHTSVINHHTVRAELRRWWNQLCSEAMISPSDPHKSIRVRVWVLFFRRLSSALPDWDPGGNFLLPGKSANKLSFTEAEFSQFIFHEILAPRCAFSQAHSAYLSLSRKLYTQLFPRDKSNEETVGRHQKKLSGGYFSFSLQSASQAASQVSSKSCHKVSSSSQPSKLVPTPEELLQQQHKILLGCKKRGESEKFLREEKKSQSCTEKARSQTEVEARAAVEAQTEVELRAAVEAQAQAASEKAIADVADAVAREKSCNLLAETYCILRGGRSLQQLHNKMRCLNYIEEQLNLCKYGEHTSCHSHRLEAYLLRSDKQELERSLCDWASRDITGQVWAKDAANILAKRTQSKHFLNQKKGQKMGNTFRPPSRAGQRNQKVFAHVKSNIDIAADAPTRVLETLSGYGSTATKQNMLHWALRCHRIYTERLHMVYTKNNAHSICKQKKKKREKKMKEMVPIDDNLVGMRHVIQQMFNGKYDGESSQSVCKSGLFNSKLHPVKTTPTLWNSRDSKNASNTKDIKDTLDSDTEWFDLSISYSQLTFTPNKGCSSGTIRGYGISQLPAISTRASLSDDSMSNDAYFHHELRYSISGKFDWISRSAQIVLRAGQASNGKNHQSISSILNGKILVYPHQILLYFAPENYPTKNNFVRRQASNAAHSYPCLIFVRSHQTKVSLSLLKDIVLFQNECRKQRRDHAARFPGTKVSKVKIAERVIKVKSNINDIDLQNQKTFISDNVETRPNLLPKTRSPPTPGTVAANLEAFALAEERAQRQGQVEDIKKQSLVSPSKSIKFQNNSYGKKPRSAMHRNYYHNKRSKPQSIKGVRGSAKELNRAVQAYPPSSLPSSSPPSPRSMIMLKQRPASRSGGELRRRDQAPKYKLKVGKLAGNEFARDGVYHIAINKFAGGPHFDARGFNFRNATIQENLKSNRSKTRRHYGQRRVGLLTPR